MWGKQSFQQMDWDNGMSHAQIKLDIYLTPNIKINTKWNKDLKVRAKAIKV